ncbi:nickel/cobalt efflux protein RcnA [Leminorella grimontii]|uniref:nickel/cobalt efflux protein RcnA n=1 Tax=Leminorella grimontii TaxID=82981 RepID=UPI00321FE0E8
MSDFTTLLQQGNAWFFIPSAILLGALHGLEPGHSKTMMAAFIIAVKGTVKQAVMLGLAATLSHTAIVWLIAFGGMYVSQKFTAQSVEPWLQMLSAVVILGTAGWMFWRTWRGERAWYAAAEHEHEHDESKIIETDRGQLELSIFELSQPPHFRIHQSGEAKSAASEIELTLWREDGCEESYRFIQKDNFLESVEEIPEPHAFSVSLKIKRDGNITEYRTDFHEHHHHELQGLEVGTKEYQDAHERAHANDIKRRFTGTQVTNGQILLFGLTGGLIPCPAAVTILLICIQIKALTLGATLVVSFSIGLAITLVAVGVGAAVSVRQAAKRWSGFNTIARRAPYFSSALIGIVGVYMGIHGYLGLMG